MNNSLPRLAKAILKSDRKPESIVRDQIPRLLTHLKRVGKQRPALARWGMSGNIDEFSGTEIVAEPILQMLQRQTGVDMHPPGLHAGVQHTYGYLLSLTKTPFGYKRTRWLTPTIEQGFALPAGSLQAFPNRGTLLGNLTDFLSMVALHDQRPLKLTPQSPIARGWNADGLTGWRITEQLNVAGRQAIEIHIDLVPFVANAKPTACALLIYSLAEAGKRFRLITTFPIGREMLTSMQELPCGNEVEIRLRFNAYVDGYDNEPMSGRRSMKPWTI